MSAPNDGGPAFPIGDHSKIVPLGGMSLRDWFAGRALFLATFACDGEAGDCQPSAHAQRAYEIADAMIVERAK